MIPRRNNPAPVLLRRDVALLVVRRRADRGACCRRRVGVACSPGRSSRQTIASPGGLTERRHGDRRLRGARGRARARTDSLAPGPGPHPICWSRARWCTPSSWRDLRAARQRGARPRRLATVYSSRMRWRQCGWRFLRVRTSATPMPSSRPGGERASTPASCATRCKPRRSQGRAAQRDRRGAGARRLRCADVIVGGRLFWGDDRLEEASLAQSSLAGS